MKAKNTGIQSAIDYICSHSGFIALDEKDFELTCPNPTICIDKKGETLNEVLEALTTAWKMLPLPNHPEPYCSSKAGVLQWLILAILKTLSMDSISSSSASTVRSRKGRR